MDLGSQFQEEILIASERELTRTCTKPGDHGGDYDPNEHHKHSTGSFDHGGDFDPNVGREQSSRHQVQDSHTITSAGHPSKIASNTGRKADSVKKSKG